MKYTVDSYIKITQKKERKKEHVSIQQTPHSVAVPLTQKFNNGKMKICRKNKSKL